MGRLLKIAMFTDTYLPTKDGVVTSILTSKEQLEKKGHEVIIFAPEPATGEKEEGVQYYKSKEFKKYPGYNLPIYIEKKIDILKDLDVDVIHCHALAVMALRGMLDARETGKPIVVTFHTMVTDAAQYYNPLPFPTWMTQRLSWIYLRKLLEHADSVIAPTDAIRKELCLQAPGMRHIDVVPTGIDCERFSTSVNGDRIREKYGLQNKKVLLQLGRVAREKNIELVMDSFADCMKKDDKITLLIAGSGPAKEYYMEYAEKAGISDRTIFAGFVPDEDLPEYYAACDAFITASKFETQGLTTLEAMACGKPVAGINYRATSEIIHDRENGFLFEDDVASCSDAIFNALNCPQEIKEHARATGERFSSEKCASMLLQAYEYAIEAKKKRHQSGRR